MGSSIVVIIILFFLFIWLNIAYKGAAWKYVDQIINWVDEYIAKAEVQNCFGFPKCEIPLYKPCVDPCGNPCESSTAKSSNTSAQNVINISCSGNGATTGTSTDCVTPCSPTINCVKDTELIFGCYKYILDKLPGIITKYKLDSNKNIIEATREIIYHNLGILVRIYLNSGSIIVEDSFSVEHTATVDPLTGNLTF